MGAASCSTCSKAEQAPSAAEAPRPIARKRRTGFNVADLVLENRGQFEDFYDLEKQAALGEGSFSSVFRCTNKETEQERAVKVIQRKYLRNLNQAEREVQITRELDHPHIVRLVEMFEDASSVKLVMDLYTGGELFDSIVDQAPFKDIVAASCLQQMLRAVAYLHSHEIVHRDLKAENWVLAENKPLLDNSLKLIDFGLARRLGSHEFARTKTGSPYYVAPEVLLGKYNHRADIWSIGVLGYMMLSGSPPVTGQNTEEVLKTIEVMKPWKCLERLALSSSEARKFMQVILEKEPDKRPPADQLLKDRWFSKALQSVILNRQPSNGEQASSRQVAFDEAVKKLLHFKVEGRLERLAMTAAVAQMSGEALRRLEKVFLDMDTNNDGLLSTEEIAAALVRAGVREDDRMTLAQRLCETLDGDGNGVVEFSEFLVANIDASTASSGKICWKAFKLFDLDGSGFIERSELARLLGSDSVNETFHHFRASDEELDDMYRELDRNKDGKIDFQEFTRILHRLDFKAT